MIKFKVVMCLILSRIVNFSFKNFINRTLFLVMLAFFIYRLLIMGEVNVDGYWMLISTVIAILSISVTRVSNNFVFSRLTKHASMIIKDTSKYQNIDYVDKKDEISNLLKKEFIEGLINISDLSNSVRFSTHKWFVENVVLTDNIKEIYDINIVKRGETSLALEILTLIKCDNVMNLNSNVINSIFRKRKAYKVKLKRIRN